jgi:MFS family permease
MGRKYSLILFSVLTSACVFTIPFIMKPYPAVATIISQIGKLGISGAVSVSWLYVPELFPTYMRGLANAIFVFIGSFGSIIAPIVTAEIDDKHERIVYYVYAGLTLALAGLITTLPETRNRSFNDEEEHDDAMQTEDDANKH